MANAGPLTGRVRSLFSRRTLRNDAMAGLALGVESVPDGLASGVLAGVNPVAGLYAYLFGTFSSAFVTSSSFMAVQGTGAMAVIVADVGLSSRDDPERALFTLSILTGVVMVLAGILKLGSLLRFVSNSVMVGFISAVGINIVLGQLGNFTGYEAPGSGRIARALHLLTGLGNVDPASVTVGVVTVALIVFLQRTRLGPLGLVVAVIAGSLLAAGAAALGTDVRLVRDIADVPRGLPFLALPTLRDLPFLAVPAVSLAFVGLVQGAGVSAGFPDPDGTMPDVSQDFVGQGVGNLASGFFHGMPVGGSMSGSSLVVAAGARTRLANMIAGAVMAAVVLLFAGVVEYVAMPALAGLLIVVGISTVKPAQMLSVAKAGRISATVMAVTLVLTMVIPLHLAVMAGVGISVILHVIRQSNQLRIRCLVIEDGRVRESDPPAQVPPADVTVLQPNGSLFFAAASAVSEQLPEVTPASRGSVVILRLRGRSEIGTTVIEVLQRYASALTRVDSKLVVVTDSERVVHQLEATGAARVLGADNIYLGTEWLGETVRLAHDEAQAWVAARRGAQPGGVTPSG